MVSLGCLFEYKTVKYVVAQNRKVGMLYRTFQLIVIAYLIGWVFLMKKKYQIVDETIESSVKTGIRGFAEVKTKDSERDLWGPEDYVVPQQGDKVFLITTNFLEAPNQTIGNCPENPSTPKSNCTSDKDCTKGETVVVGNGIKTGKCNLSMNTCEIYGWCPVEMRKRPDVPTLSAAENFTLYIKNFVRFSKFNFSKSNVLQKSNRAYLKTCFYNRTTGQYCPVFRLGYIVQEAGHNFQEMAVEGGSIGILIEWRCDLDKGYSECHPRYHFTQLDAENTTKYKFTKVHYFRDANGVKHRTLYTAFGIHFSIIIYGAAGKFNIIPTLVNIGSTLAFLGAGSYFCDIILLYTMKRSTLYRVSKYETVIKHGKRKEELEDTA